MMKDLDFDELDQAVNSLMIGIPKGPAPDDDVAKEKMLTIKPTLSDNERPSFSTLEQTAAKAGAEIETVAAPTNPLATRRTSGRFMDVVHPSSDMKINNRPVVSREGLQLNPITPRSVIAPQPSVELPVVDDVVADQTPEVIEQPKQTGDWPDPLDMQPAIQEESVAQEVPIVEEEVAPVPDPIAAPAVATPVIEEQAPLQTPFLVDTKVEKRPLGAFATDLHSAADDVPAEQPSADLGNQLEADDLSKNPDTITKLPDELQHDLVKIESDNDEPKEEAVEEPKIPSFAAPVVTPAPVVANGPVSIQPQYKEEESTVPAEHAGIYDTESYHKPLTHPAKKKSGWLWVVWIVLLLALGAGGAAALYYYKII
jgi:hypothetical protein